MPKKSTYLLTLTACAMIVVSGCGSRQAAETPRNNVQSSSPSPSVSVSASPGAAPVSSPAANAQEKQIHVYFGNEDATALVEKPVQLKYTTPSSKYINALNAMKKSDDPKSVPLMTNFTFKSAELKEGNLVVDLSMKESDSFGASGEGLLIKAIQQTLFQFEEVKTIDLLVDGQKKESLMGHVELQHPIKKP